MQFKDKIVWITGASSGIGEALVYAFDQEGAKVVLSARREAELERVVKKCKYSENMYILPLDLANHDEMSAKVDEVIEKFGEIDILINNGGISQRSLVKNTPLSVDKRIMDIDYFGTIALTKAALPFLLKNENSHIVVITSLMGKFATPLRSAYAAAKHALHGFFDALRLEHWRDGLGVLIVAPGFIRTNVSLNALTETGKKQNTMDDAQANGMPPEVLAQKVCKAIMNGKEEIVIGGAERHAILLRRLLPGVFSRMMKNRKDFT